MGKNCIYTLIKRGFDLAVELLERAHVAELGGERVEGVVARFQERQRCQVHQRRRQRLPNVNIFKKKHLEEM